MDKSACKYKEIMGSKISLIELAHEVSKQVQRSLCMYTDRVLRKTEEQEMNMDCCSSGANLTVNRLRASYYLYLCIRIVDGIRPHAFTIMYLKVKC